MVDSSRPASSKVSSKQKLGAATAAAAPPVVPKLTIKSEALSRTVVSQTLSTTLVHVSEFGTFYHGTPEREPPLL